MNLDILSLHKKAQNGGLTAQEVFWLENQQAEHPYCGMVYMILARHQYRNQSTIRNRALLKGATYSNNRSLLRNYLEDTLIPPKQKPVPVKEMKPILEKKDQEAKENSLVVESEEKANPIEEIQSSESTELNLSADPVAESSSNPDSDQIPGEIEGKPEEVLTPETKTEIVQPLATDENLESENKTEPVMPQDVQIVANEQLEEIKNSESSLGTTKSEINWFLNMRLKLRSDKYKAIGARLRDEIANQPIETSKQDSKLENKVADQVDAKAESELKPSGNEATKKNAEKESEVVSAMPETNYEIGEYSSFSFIAGESAEVLEEEIDKGFSGFEAIEFQSFDGNSEIVLEENDRIVEVSVSPEALNKYFKGKLPLDQAFSIGEFHIELDEEEYRMLEEQKETVDSTPQPKAKANVDALIDKFIENEPAITRGGADFSNLGDLSKNSNRENDDWVTETLAKIYEKQGNYSKAIKIYQKLRLRFPEKNDYFAGLIENLKR